MDHLIYKKSEHKNVNNMFNQLVFGVWTIKDIVFTSSSCSSFTSTGWWD